MSPSRRRSPRGRAGTRKGAARAARNAGDGREERPRGEPVVERSRGVFMISVAAELADMHPQTLRLYEARGLITPKRSPKNTRLYSHEDVDRLRRIQEMTVERGLNLAGVETVLELEERLEEMREEVRRMRARADELERKITEEVAQARETLATEMIPYGAYDPNEIVSGRAQPRVRIPVSKPRSADR